jgi:hypothetical protein
MVLNCGRQCMTDFKVGEYYKCSEDNDIIHILEVYTDSVVFNVVEDLSPVWSPKNPKSLSHYDAALSSYKHYPIYNTPLYKILNP